MDTSTPIAGKTLRPKAGTSAAPVLTSVGAPRRVPSQSLLRFSRIFRSRRATTYQRCLAVHMYFAQRPSALD